MPAVLDDPEFGVWEGALHFERHRRRIQGVAVSVNDQGASGNLFEIFGNQIHVVVVNGQPKSMLKPDEKASYTLTRFAQRAVDGKSLRAVMEAGWLAWDIDDWGNVSHYTCYFEAENITARILLEPRINDHHPDDRPRTIREISFSRDRRGSLSQTDGRLSLGEVPDTVLKAVFDGVMPLCDP